MTYWKIVKHIISRRYYLYYGIVIIMSLILVFLSFYTSILALLIFWLSVMSIGCVLVNMYRCRNFHQFYENSFKAYNAQFIRVVIEKEDYKMQVPYKSYNATVRPLPKSTNAIYIETDNLLIFFSSIQHLGIFQLVLKPFVFIKLNKGVDIRDNNVHVVQNIEVVETREGRTIIFPNKHDIKKIMIPY